MKEFRQKQLIEAINKQFEINWINKTYEDVKWVDNWFLQYTTTQEKEDEFKEWLFEFIKPYTYPSRRQREVGWFLLSYGLKLESNE